MKWSSIRLDVGTLRMLSEYRDRLEKAAAARPEIYPDFDGKTKLSLGDTVFFLLRLRQRHHERRRKAERNRPCGEGEG